MRGRRGLIRDDFARVTWKKSTRSNGSGDCVEMARLLDGMVGVRDSKNPAGAVLAVSGTAWSTFLMALKAGEFDG